MDPLGHLQVSSVETVEQQLAEMWHGATKGDRAVVRACTMNLVIVCADGDEDVHEATRVVAGVSETEPGRALMLSRPSGSGRGRELEIYASAHCHRGADGTQVCSEQVTLEIRAGGESLLPQTVLQLLVEDMPVVLWWRRPRLRLDPLFQPLSELADRIVVDSADFELPAEALRTMQAIADNESWRGHAFDLGWMRMEPWREALAAAFDDPSRQAGLGRLEALEVVAGGPTSGSARTTSASLIAGWLASRLDWSPDCERTWQRADGGRIRIDLRHEPDLDAGALLSVRLVAAEGSPWRVLEARRTSDEGDVRLSFDACDLSAQHLRLPQRDETALLCGILQRGEQDALFEAALRNAARMD